MRVCVLMPVLDAFKGGNHLPLFAALPEIEFTILTNRTNPRHATLPANVHVEIVPGRLGPYMYGWSDYRFAQLTMRKHPTRSPFWQQFDVLHLNQTMGPQFLALTQTGKPVLSVIHHPVSVDRAVAMAESRVFGKMLWYLKYALLVRWQKRLCRSLPHIATVSQTVAKRLEADYGCPAERISVIPNGVDGTLFQSVALEHTEFDVVAVGSFIHPRKGFPYLLRAYRALAAQGLRIADVGRRSDAQQAELRTVPGVQILGMVSPEQLRTTVQRSAVLIGTSLYEGFGLSLIEALSCGRPAFAFDAGATGEVLRSIDTTLVVPLRDTDALVRRISAFLTLPQPERVRRGKHYREAVLHHYSLQASADLLRDCYQRIAS